MSHLQVPERRWNRVIRLRDWAVPKGSALFPFLPLLHCGASRALRPRNDRVALPDNKTGEGTRSACFPQLDSTNRRGLATTLPGLFPYCGRLIAPRPAIPISLAAPARRVGIPAGQWQARYRRGGIQLRQSTHKKLNDDTEHTEDATQQQPFRPVAVLRMRDGRTNAGAEDPNEDQCLQVHAARISMRADRFWLFHEESAPSQVGLSISSRRAFQFPARC